MAQHDDLVLASVFLIGESAAEIAPSGASLSIAALVAIVLTTAGSAARFIRACQADDAIRLREAGNLRQRAGTRRASARRSIAWSGLRDLRSVRNPGRHQVRSTPFARRS